MPITTVEGPGAGDGGAVLIGFNGKKSGRYWNRTSDSYRVKVVLYL